MGPSIIIIMSRMNQSESLKFVHYIHKEPQLFRLIALRLCNPFIFVLLINYLHANYVESVFHFCAESGLSYHFPSHLAKLQVYCVVRTTDKYEHLGNITEDFQILRTRHLFHT